MMSVNSESRAAGYRLFLLVTILIGFTAAAILYHSLPWGIGVSPDSVAYLKSASRFVTDYQFSHLPSHWPPAYPLFLALLTTFVPNITFAALFGQILLFALNTIAFCLFVYYCLDSAGKYRYLIAIFAGAVFACNPSLLLLHQYAVSEALFIFLLFISASACLWYLDGERLLQFVIAALLVGLLPVTRYAGLPFLPIFAALIFFGLRTNTHRRRNRTWVAIGFALLSSLPLVCWLVLNSVKRGESTNRTLEYHPIALSRLEELLSNFQAWFEIPGSSALTIVVMLCIGVAGFRAVNNLPSTDKRKMLAAGLPLAAFVYILFLLISISFFDAYSPLDQRMLLPAWVLLFTAIFISLQAATTSRITFCVFLVALIPVLLGYGLKSIDQIDYSRRNGLGYNTPSAATSELLAIVKKEFPGQELYSNASDYILLHTGHEVRGLPVIYDSTTRRQNPQFIYEMAAILEKVDKQEAAVVYFDGFEFRQYYPTSEQLVNQFSLNSTRVTNDGIYFNRMNSDSR